MRGSFAYIALNGMSLENSGFQLTEEQSFFILNKSSPSLRTRARHASLPPTLNYLNPVMENIY